MSEGVEAELRKHYRKCKRNSGHVLFTPVEEFSIADSPVGFRDEHLVKFIKAFADLTVRVCVPVTSPKRPEFWPDTDVGYSFYNEKRQNFMRTGTGRIKGVYKYTAKDKQGACPCAKCLRSESPSKVWGKVRMYTARHVIFDELEAEQANCRLFYDRRDGPLVTLDGWALDGADVTEDWCVVTHPTCDPNLLDKLDEMCDHWWHLWCKVYNKYESSRQEARITFIVSHPHGCSKQISLGRWMDRCVVKEDGRTKFTKYTYTTCTCPGSSRAHVYTLGYYDVWADVLHVHSGVNSETLS